MYKLVTIADLSQEKYVVKSLTERAMQLSTFYNAWKQHDPGGRKYTVEVHSEITDRAPGIHASEISKCLRVVVYSLLNVPRKVSPENIDGNMKRRFGVGHAIHAMLQSEMAEMSKGFQGALDFEEEVGIHPDMGGLAAEWNLHSSCDGVFTFKTEQHVPYLRVGLEIKTQSALEFEKSTKPSQTHLEQTCLYMAALDLPLMWLLYYNKSNSNYTQSTPPFLYSFNHTLWERTLEMRFAKAHHLASIGQIPDRSEGMWCRWCPFSHTCTPKILQTVKGSASPTLSNPGAFR